MRPGDGVISEIKVVNPEERIVSANIQLEQDIRAALERDPRILEPADIAVSEHGGVVTLRGTVNSIGQRRAAAEDAQATAGVDEVIDQLEVRLLEDDVWDDRLRGAVLQRLVEDQDVPADSLDVKVKDGWVTLKGQVKHQFQSDAAYDDATTVDGVGGITNEIRVVSAG